MESEEEVLYNESEEEEEDEDDSGNESSGGDDDDGLSVALLDSEPTVSANMSSKDKMDFDEDFPFEVLTTEQIMQHMQDCIKEVNNVVQLPPTITRILLNHFKWDKEKLYERYYDGDRGPLFSEAHIIDPAEAYNNQQIKVNQTLTTLNSFILTIFQ